jgi:hypothetical protein
VWRAARYARSVVAIEADSMWTCKQCGETSEDDFFDVCWNCGTGRDGSAAAKDFQPVVSGDQDTDSPLPGSSQLVVGDRVRFCAFRPSTTDWGGLECEWDPGDALLGAVATITQFNSGGWFQIDIDQRTAGSSRVGCHPRRITAGLPVSLRPPPCGAVGAFHSVHPVGIVMELVVLGVKSQLSSGSTQVSEAGILASIFVSELAESRLVVTAGNVLDTYFNFIVELAVEGSGTKGHASLDRPFSEIKRWMGSAQTLAYELKALLNEASVSFDRWDVR